MRSFLRLLLAAVVAVVALPTGAKAQAEFTGTYRLVEAESDNIHQAIDAAVRGMNFVTRPIARTRLRRTNEAHREVRIERADGHYVIGMDDRAPTRAPSDGTPVQWTREDGEVLEVTTSVRGGVLRQTFQAEDGRRANDFHLSEDGRVMTMRVTITSDRLPEPLTYRLVYRRR
jgi:hypothetical protein